MSGHYASGGIVRRGQPVILEREWVELDITGFGDPEPRSIQVPGRCFHARLVDVDLALTGEVVAKLCLTCDEQLPADWVSPYAPPSIAELQWPEDA